MPRPLAIRPQIRAKLQTDFSFQAWPPSGPTPVTPLKVFDIVCHSGAPTGRDVMAELIASLVTPIQLSYREVFHVV